MSAKHREVFMQAGLENPIRLSERHHREVRRMSDLSHKQAFDLNQSIPWALGVDRALPPKLASTSWIYDTQYWHALSEEQRHGLLWEENARDVSMFIWLEQTLPPLYMGYVTRYGDKLTPDVLEYLMIFSKEEIVHTLAFRRYMALANLEAFRPPEGLQQLFAEALPKMPPVTGILCTLIVEYIAELSAMYASQHEGIDPLTRALFKRHHQDELRHIAFGRYVAESFFARASAAEAEETRTIVRQLFSRTLAQFTYNHEISERVTLGIEGDEAIAAIRSSTQNKELNAKRFSELFRWLVKLEVLPC